MALTDSNIVVCHCTNYDVRIYSKEGSLILDYSKKPKFYSEFNKPPDLNNPKEMKLWDRHTSQYNALPYNNNIMISYYSRVDEKESWLFVQDKTQSKVIKLPKHLILKFILGNKFYFLNRQSDGIKSITLECYELINNIL